MAETAAPRRGAVSMLVSDLVRHHPSRSWVALFFSIAAPLAEGVALALVAPIAASLSGGGQRATLELLLAAGGLMLLRAWLGYLRTSTALGLAADYEAELGRRVVAAMAARGWPFVRGLGAGRAQALIERDSGAAVTAAHYALMLAGAVALLVAQCAAALVTSWRLALAGLLLMAVAALILYPFVRHARGMGNRMLESAGDATGNALRLTGEMKTALAQGSEARFLRRYSASLRRAALDRARFGRDQARVSGLLVAVGTIVAFVIVWLGASVFDVDAAHLVAVLLILARMVGPGQAVLTATASLVAEAQGMARLRATLGTLDAAAKGLSDGAPLAWSTLEAKAIRYNAARLGPIDLTLDRGEWLALDGPSGSGKTSLIDMIVGLMPPDSGSILVDGEPLVGEAMEGWRQSIGYVGQDEYLFSASIADNLSAGAGPRDEEQLRAMIELVGLAGIVRNLPDGMATPIGDRGQLLSGGERQRLGIARALLRQPSLLVLDEATSALDEEAEARLIDRIRDGYPDLAVLLVAHRASTRAHADRALGVNCN